MCNLVHYGFGCHPLPLTQTHHPNREGMLFPPEKEEEGVRWGWWGNLDGWMWMLIMMYLALNATFPTLPLNVCKPPADLVEQRSPKGRGTIFPRKISVGVGNGMGWCQSELRGGVCYTTRYRKRPGLDKIFKKIQ